MDRRALLAGVAAGLWGASARAQQACFDRMDCFDTQLPGPSLDLQFTSGVLDPRITFTRASVATYFDVAGTLQSAASGAPRFDFDWVTHAANGLLIEEARTNSLRNSVMTGAVAASPGTTPTNWTLTAPTGVTRTITLPVVGGIQYIDVNYSGTTSSTAQITFQTDSNTAIAAVSGQAWTASMYFQVTQDDVALTALTHAVQGMTSVPALAESFTASLQAGRLTLSRATLSATLANGTTASVRQTLATNSITSGTVINLTFRIGAPQLELGSFASSYIATTAAAATRAADVATMATGTWFNTLAGAVVAEYLIGNAPPAGTQGGILVLWDGSANNELVMLLAPTTGLASSFAQIGGVPQLNIAFASGVGAVEKQAITYGGSGWRTAFNAGAPQFAASGSTTLPATTLRIGASFTGAFYANGTIRRIRYWPRTLGTGELQAVTQ